MTTLTEKIKAAATSKPQPGPSGEDSQAIQRLIAAKSGKAEVPGGIRKAMIGEGQAISLGKSQLAQQQAASDATMANIQAQEEDVAKVGQLQQKKFGADTRNIQKREFLQRNEILDQYSQGIRKIKTNKDIQDLEQIGFSIRLSNDQYVNQIQQMGQKNRLDSEVGFKKELMKQVFADNEAILKNEMAFRVIMDADERTFQEELSKMDVNYALEIAKSAAKAANMRAVTSGISGATSGAFQAYGAYKNGEGDT